MALLFTLLLIQNSKLQTLEYSTSVQSRTIKINCYSFHLDVNYYEYVHNDFWILKIGTLG